MSPASDRTVVNLAVDIDLWEYADSYNLAGPRSARDDIKTVVLEAARAEFKRMGYPPECVSRMR
ncbi:hypothetical protein SSEA_SKINNY_147 [Mycobacterium phage Skinny]|uniref:Uncharacterized protein n=1 Tax=Mycobacterium phage LilhomieP TaxID=2591221 RepID=A0A514DJC5_9CAUD|nr:hypothetical protein SEA_LILHOMIEP_141 [Mycobacterium phage LilhomieP]QUU29325.1 hypothetical protein [Mycobacterium phage SirSheldon]UXE05316.1 hypothetical protein SSEA_SKINNY_147 [Mycobacterium phage Skinny]WNN95699.1 hypothetical protein SEA_GLASKE16_143 [Mycobacterium phage Glaske16]WNN96297.1 hypothetical protein SEA_DULCITA_141 [Mycobacterium phage Dulcita]WNO28243.1 hypothetical protein SEA_DIMINIMUS_141 [Mycobacterium phage Diminimus]